MRLVFIRNLGLEHLEPHILTQGFPTKIWSLFCTENKAQHWCGALISLALRGA